MSCDAVNPFEPISAQRNTVRSRDLRREKLLLRKAIATTKGEHRIRLQRELAALEEYERTQIKRKIENPVWS